jgi:hypothetical protein
MKRHGVLLAVSIVLGCGRDEPAPQADAGPEPGSTAWKIQTARSAAPWQVSVGATVVEMSGDSLVTLESGSTGWTCILDDPATPAVDPICADATFMEWIAAWQQNTPPRIRSMGVAYMLRGGQTASDSDPRKMTLDEGAAWLEDPPHLMVVMPNPRASFAGLPTSRTPAAPWIMYAGTPYAHLMVPAGAGQ